MRLKIYFKQPLVGDEIYEDEFIGEPERVIFMLAPYLSPYIRIMRYELEP